MIDEPSYTPLERADRLEEVLIENRRRVHRNNNHAVWRLAFDRHSLIVWTGVAVRELKSREIACKVAALMTFKAILRLLIATELNLKVHV